MYMYVYALCVRVSEGCLRAILYTHVYIHIYTYNIYTIIYTYTTHMMFISMYNIALHICDNYIRLYIHV